MKDQDFIILGSTLVTLGIIFSEDWLIGYSLIGAGVLLSIVSAFKSKSKMMM